MRKDEIESQRTIGTANQVGDFGKSGYTYLDANDVLKIKSKINSGTSTLNFNEFNFWIKRMP